MWLWRNTERLLHRSAGAGIHVGDSYGRCVMLTQNLSGYSRLLVGSVQADRVTWIRWLLVRHVVAGRQPVVVQRLGGRFPTSQVCPLHPLHGGRVERQAVHRQVLLHLQERRRCVVATVYNRFCRDVLFSKRANIAVRWSPYGGRTIKTKFHYASWFEAGSKLVADRR